MVLSRAPVAYKFWRRHRVFCHGAMEDSEYAIGMFTGHLERSGLAAPKKGFIVLELGPGDSLSSAIIANAFGAGRCWLVDGGDFATRDLSVYRALTEALLRRGLQSFDPGSVNSADEMLKRIDAVYLTAGLSSLRTIADQSVDFIWSQAVLEHVRLDDFAATIREFRRVISPGGVASHRVDFTDHLGGALNNLRFPDWIWESAFFANSGFYTNRLRSSEMLQIFGEAGFDVEVKRTECWDQLPTQKTAHAPPIS